MITIQGKPISKSRPRFSRLGRVYSDQTDMAQATALDIKLQWTYEPLSGPLRVVMVFYMPIPKSATKKERAKLLGSLHAKKPDIDNMIKYYLDCMNGIVFEDDNQVAVLESSKLWSLNPRTEIVWAVVK